MRTLFLLGILGALIVIATKDDNQTAMEAALEMGQKALRMNPSDIFTKSQIKKWSKGFQVQKN